MHDNVSLEITYQSYWRESPHTFEIEPYFVKIFKQRWYLIARSPYYDNIRIYALDRIQNISVTENKFKIPDNFIPEEYFVHCFGIINEAENYPPCIVQLKVSGWQAQYFRSLPLHHSQKELERTEEFSTFECFIQPTFDFRQELLSQGEDVEVLKPEKLREEMREIAGLWKRDFQTGQEGYTLAAALLFGKDDVIQQIIPHYKIDAMVRVENVERYDDREYIQTNLIEAYDILMGFVAKHLSDQFYMEGDQRMSLRTKIFREVVANLIVHREYTNAYPCKFTIFSDRVETENANNPRGQGKIDPTNFSPFPKNPTIAKFFLQLGRVEELGSGVLNVSHYVKEYSGGEASFIEGDIFRTIIPITKISAADKTENTDDVTNDAINGAINKATSSTINDVVNNAINDAVEKGVIDNLSDAVIDGVVETMRIIHTTKGGVRSKDIISQIKKSSSSVDRYLDILRKINLIIFQGSNKSGKYLVKPGTVLSKKPED